MSADPPQVLNTGIFAGYQNAVVIDRQFIEVLHFSILFTWILSIMMTHRSTTIFQTLLTLIYLLYLLLNMLVLSLQVKISTCRNFYLPSSRTKEKFPIAWFGWHWQESDLP